MIDNTAVCPGCGSTGDFFKWSSFYAENKGWIDDWLTYDKRAAAGHPFCWLECPVCSYRWKVYYEDNPEKGNQMPKIVDEMSLNEVESEISQVTDEINEYLRINETNADYQAGFRPDVELNMEELHHYLGMLAYHREKLRGQGVKA